jgi:hypothetical protein
MRTGSRERSVPRPPAAPPVPSADRSGLGPASEARPSHSAHGGGLVARRARPAVGSVFRVELTVSRRVPDQPFPVSKISQKWPLLGCARGRARATLEVVRVFLKPPEDLEAPMYPDLRSGSVGWSGRRLPALRAHQCAR